MGLLAALKVMLGIDSVEFQAKMRDAGERVSLFENEFGKRSTLVERHGLRLVRTAEGIGSSMQRMNVDAGGALMQFAESIGWGKIALGIGGIAATYGVLKAATDAVARSALTAGKPVGEMAAALVEDGAAMESVAAQVDMLAKRLGTSGDELGINTAATIENAVGLLTLRDALEKELKQRQLSSAGYKEYLVQQKIAAEQIAEEKKLHRESVTWLDAMREAQARFNAVHGQFISPATQVAIALAAGTRKMKEFTDEARRSAGVWNAEDLRAKADLLQKQVVAIAQSGGSASQTVNALGGQFAEVVKVAAELGVQLDPQFTDIADAVKQGPSLAMDDLFARFKGMPKQVEESSAASGRSLDELGKALEGKVKGGFLDGVAGGTSEATKELEEWAAGVHIRIPVELDTAALQRQLEEIKSGRIPTTTGSAP